MAAHAVEHQLSVLAFRDLHLGRHRGTEERGAGMYIETACHARVIMNWQVDQTGLLECTTRSCTGTAHRTMLPEQQCQRRYHLLGAWCSYCTCGIVPVGKEGHEPIKLASITPSSTVGE